MNGGIIFAASKVNIKYHSCLMILSLLNWRFKMRPSDTTSALMVGVFQLGLKERWHLKLSKNVQTLIKRWELMKMPQYVHFERQIHLQECLLF